VLPQVPLRPFMLVMPFAWHHRLARDAELETRSLALFVEDVCNHLRGVTGVTDDLPGSVTSPMSGP
jgi:hypothetical protein